MADDLNTRILAASDKLLRAVLLQLAADDPAAVAAVLDRYEAAMTK